MALEQPQSSEPGPVFMFGFERSGTTLLSMMVGAHPTIAVPFSVTGLWYRYGTMLDRYNHLQSAEDLKRIVDDLLAEERIGLWDVKLNRDEIIPGLTVGSYPSVIQRFHELYAKHCGKSLWGNIDILTLYHMDKVHKWFPQARYIHIVRDGRDVALSHKTMPFGSANLGLCADRWARDVNTSLKMGAIAGPDKYFVVRYEDLILEAEDTLRRMCDFLGVEYSSQMLEYHKMVGGKVPEEKLWLWPKLNKPPDKSNAYRWKSKMGGLQRAVFERSGNDVLKALGYEAFDAVPKSISAILLQKWYLLNVGGYAKSAAAKIGFRRASQLERKWRSGKNGKDQPEGYKDAQQQAFGGLVQSGAISADFRHAPGKVAFVKDCVIQALSAAHAERSVSILDCGCGTGVWLECMRETRIAANQDDDRFFGFDLTPEMIGLAKKRLALNVPADHLQVGDVLRDESYCFTQSEQTYDLVFAYDIVQQLPRNLQMKVCTTLLSHLAPKGVVLIFDHDCRSYYGRVMGFKKFVTRYLKINLVPPFYTNARYPALAQIARRIQSDGPYKTEIRVSPEGNKRALIVRSQKT